MRPVVEIQFADFIFPAFNQLVSEAALFHFEHAKGGIEVPDEVFERFCLRVEVNEDKPAPNRGAERFQAAVFEIEILHSLGAEGADLAAEGDDAGAFLGGMNAVA